VRSPGPRETLHSVQKLFEADRAIVAAFGMKLLEVSATGVSVAMTVKETMLNSQRICHGGFVFTLADTAAAYTVATLGVAPITTGASIAFIAGAEVGEEILAHGRFEVDSTRVAHVVVRVRGTGGRDLAIYNGQNLKRGTI